MHALRLHKVGVSGRDKLREARRVQQVTRQRAARGNVLQVLRSFLTADAFMYGPLVDSPPSAVDVSDDDDDHSEPHAPEREQEDGGSDVNDTNEEENDANSDKHEENGHEENAAAVKGQRGSRSVSTKTILSVTQRSKRTTIRGLKP